MSEEEAMKEIENYLDYEGSVSIQAIAILYSAYNKEKEKNKKIEETVKKGMKNLWIDSCVEDSGKYSAYMSIRNILEE